MRASQTPGGRPIRAHAIAVAAVVAAGIGAFDAGAQSPPSSATALASAITYFIGAGSVGSGFRQTDRQLAEWAFDAWQRSATNAFRFVPSAETDALVRLYWAEPNDGQYGEMRAIQMGDRRAAAVYIRPDTTALGEAIATRAARDPLLRDAIVYLTAVHELGHALGLSHSREFDDIMYFFGYGGDVVAYFNRYRVELRTRDDIHLVSGLSSADISRVRTLYARP